MHDDKGLDSQSSRHYCKNDDDEQHEQCHLDCYVETSVELQHDWLLMNHITPMSKHNAQLAPACSATDDIGGG
jgi:hypothetical protein